MKTLLLIVSSTIFISLISLAGVFILCLNQKILEKIILILVSLSAGTLMGVAFLHFLPESFLILKEKAAYLVLVGFVLFFLIEKIFHWRHCHKGHCKIHTFAYVNLFGDLIHNFLDGMIIAAGFLMSLTLGISTTIAIALHEIPQEMGDLGVLIYGGFKKTKAIMINLLTALTAVLGGIFGYFLADYIQNSVNFILPIATGGFIYTAASDLIPEIRKDPTKKSLFYLLIFILGIIAMYFLKD